MENTSEKDIFKRKLTGSLLYFTQIFFTLRTGKEFKLSTPQGRESHYITICKELTNIIDGKTNRLIINVPPRYGKTELLIHFIAWTLGQYPDSNFLYISYSHSLAKKQTQTIRNIIKMREYRDYFGVQIKEDTSAKDNFETNKIGSVYAAGAGGSITGRGAGINGCDRFGGCIVIDDIHKPDEVMSDTIREGINEWYYNTLQSRINSPNTPIIFIGQRLHEYDLASKLIKEHNFKTVIIPAIDEIGNILHPEMHDLNTLKDMKDKSPYVFYSQYQQNPMPAGGALFKEDWFPLLDEIPNILATFITGDSAETKEEYNDATVFSFWGLYKLKFKNEYIPEMYGLYWIDCVEIRIEPHDLEDAFLDFWTSCMRFHVKPQYAAIEKKSTGVTLLSTLKKIQGLRILDIERKGHIKGVVNSKANRFIDLQQYIASKQISLPVNGKHTNMCISHMKKITANNTHRWDDIADTCYDAVKMALIDKIIIYKEDSKNKNDDLARNMMSTYRKVDRLRKNAYS